MAKKILITGGTGFLGVHLARLCLNKGYIVSLFDIADLDAKDLIGRVTFFKGDVRNISAIDTAMRDQDYVVHAAAALPIQFRKDVIFSVNINGTKNVLESAFSHKVKRLVFISSTAVYGIPKRVPETETTSLSPIGHYGVSKVEGEKLCIDYQRKGLEVNILRPKTFLGIERLGVFTLWFEAIFAGRSVFVLGEGNNIYQLLAVSDLVEAIEKALISKVSGMIFNIGAKKFSTWRSDLGYVIEQVHSKSKIISLPKVPSQLILRLLEIFRLSPLVAWHYKTVAIDSFVAIDKAEKFLKWHPKRSNKELLLENYLWYEKHRREIYRQSGKTHRINWNFRLLELITKL